jgi:hypothetical protein
LPEVIEELLEDRRFEFAVERAVFLTVLHRLCAPGSDRAADRWRHAHEIKGVDGLALHHLYRAMAWLGESLSDGEQVYATLPDKALVGNKGYRKYIKSRGKQFEIDRQKEKEEARFDGKWVLRTNWTWTEPEAAEAAEVAHVLADLHRLERITLRAGGARCRLRTSPAGVAGKVLQAAGVGLGPTVRFVEPPPDDESAAKRRA